MKKILMTGIAAIAAFVAVGARGMTLAEAAAKVADAAESPSAMASVMKELSAEAQVKFLASVNGAIEKMPVSEADKAEKFLAANKAAMQNAAKGNLSTLLAETYATVPLSALTVINERFAADLFNRSADGKRVSDEMMKSNALVAVEAVKDRTAKGDVSNSAERNAFAALTFIRASEGSPADLRDALLAGLPAEAKSEWIPAALGEGEPASYDAILGGEGAASNAQAPSSILPQAPASLTGALAADLSGTVDDNGRTTSSFTDAVLDPNQYALPASGADFGLDGRVPRTQNPDNPWYNGAKRGENKGEGGGYPWQLTEE